MTTVSDLFELRYGHSLELNSLEPLSGVSGGVNFVGRSAKRNGVTARVRLIEGLPPAEPGALTVALGGQGGAGVAFLQPFPFYCGRDVMILRARAEMTVKQKLWWACCISANRYRFGFGRQANTSLASLSLPQENTIPKWVATVNLDIYKDSNKPIMESATANLGIKTWLPFRYDLLFSIVKGDRLTQANMKLGETPFVGAIDSNNGHRQRISATPNHKGNAITVSYNGSVAEAFYQNQNFLASDDINVLYPNFPLTKYSALFLCAVIRQEKFRYNYGRKWHLERMREAIMRLPVDDKGNPDWLFMEDYIKSLPFSKAI